MYRVVPVKEFDEQFEKLRQRAKRGDGESIKLVKLIEKGINKLKYDYKYGDHVSKERIPKEYVQKYGVKNLWKLDLSSFWRLIYTVRGSEIEVISVILEVLDHKKYDRKFGYKTS
jgi:mRNA-degrading endonuclease YafQ of YafQ-DinJ toxin-antitoxin module